MRYALISDIHGNLPALEAVLADIDARESVDAVYHLGDLGGYAPWPNEVVATLRDRGLERAVEAIHRSELPDELADQLRTGGTTISARVG